MALTNKLTAIADAIREKTGSTEPLTLDAMPTAISGITTGGGGGGELVPEDFIITGDCSRRFMCNGWTSFIERHENDLRTENITDASYMFSGNGTIRKIPFDINLTTEGNGASITYMFESVSLLTELPKVRGKINSLNYPFDYCPIEVFPEDFYDDIDFSYIDENSIANEKGAFCRLQNLLRVPAKAMEKMGKCPTRSTSNSIYKDMFYYDYVLSDIESLPVAVATFTSNTFTDTFKNCYRLHSVTFATDNGVAKTANWKSQTIDLSALGHGGTYMFANKFTGGVEVKDEATYQQYKDHDRWYTGNVNYSRFNRTSAVELINTLPDTSAYLAEKGGTNTIKFTGAAGALTDGGAINTMTEEEIAVATAKGWTVTLV